MSKEIKEIRKNRVEVAQSLSPNLTTRVEFDKMKKSAETIDIDSGKSYAQKRLKQKLTMTGTSKTVSFPSKHGFKDYKSVVVTLSGKTTVAMYGEMINNNTFKITASSALTDVEIHVLLRGN